MEKQKLPNVTIALVLGIVSFIACCCSYGIGGLILSGIAFYLVKKDTALLAENPDLYDNAGQLKTARTIAIIGLVLAGLWLIIAAITIITSGGFAGMEERQRELMEQYGIQ